MCKLEDYTLQN